MLTSKHHNLNKLVWRYGLTSAAAVLLAFGGGASSVKAEASAIMTPEQRAKKLKKLKAKLENIQMQKIKNSRNGIGMELVLKKTNIERL
ncbi:TPA: hypothetical protein VMM66_000641 [Streptococcus pyogenes]|nr:hypothetical protein [Streptococcus pyogenes]